MAFLDALSMGRDSPLRPTIQDLERFASDWASLIPTSPAVRATVAHLPSQRFKFTHRDVPGIRSALGLGSETVQCACQRQYHRSLEAIYAAQITPTDRLRCAWAALAGRLEFLPPFWTVFPLTLTETVGACILALPIALAGVGPLAGVVILIVFGLTNSLEEIINYASNHFHSLFSWRNRKIKRYSEFGGHAGI